MIEIKLHFSTLESFKIDANNLASARRSGFGTDGFHVFVVGVFDEGEHLGIGLDIVAQGLDFQVSMPD